MNIEYEATFPNIKKDTVRARLAAVGAECTRPEFLQKRSGFHLPDGHEIPGGWLRVRNEGNKITTSLKIVDGSNIESQKELCLAVDDFDKAMQFLSALGARQKTYQESKRELWRLDEVEITIDEWPFLEPFVEIEGKSEQAVRAVAEKLGFDYATAKFCAVTTLYAEKYGISEDRINNHTPRIVFDMKNPFLR